MVRQISNVHPITYVRPNTYGRTITYVRPNTYGRTISYVRPITYVRRITYACPITYARQITYVPSSNKSICIGYGLLLVFSSIRIPSHYISTTLKCTKQPTIASSAM